MTTWREQGKCWNSSELAKLMFPVQSQEKVELSYRESPARAYCELCPVQVECLDYALEWLPEFGIWAGYSPKELRRIRTGRMALVG